MDNANCILQTGDKDEESINTCTYTADLCYALYATCMYSILYLQFSTIFTQLCVGVPFNLDRAINIMST